MGDAGVMIKHSKILSVKDLTNRALVEVLLLIILLAKEDVLPGPRGLVWTVRQAPS